jgi:hypothetical protein
MKIESLEEIKRLRDREQEKVKASLKKGQKTESSQTKASSYQELWGK